MITVQKMQRWVDAAWYAYWIAWLKFAARLIGKRACVVNAWVSSSANPGIVITGSGGPVLIIGCTVGAPPDGYGIQITGADT
ncbi:MAG: hypothetical protein AB7I42_26005 [Bradyrhizobium sp.]|uniref:hypothetical protein n=1 Tax=Bradyrhizobium sp. TaxID=376 RepID=UPI003D14526C